MTQETLEVDGLELSLENITTEQIREDDWASELITAELHIDDTVFDFSEYISNGEVDISQESLWHSSPNEELMEFIKVHDIDEIKFQSAIASILSEHCEKS